MPAVEHHQIEYTLIQESNQTCFFKHLHLIRSQVTVTITNAIDAFVEVRFLHTHILPFHIMEMKLLLTIQCFIGILRQAFQSPSSASCNPQLQGHPLPTDQDTPHRVQLTNPEALPELTRYFCLPSLKELS